MNELEIQRIVDGECDHESRSRWLRSLEDDAPQWRTLALRLLEDQAMRKLFSTDSAMNLQAPQRGGSESVPRGSSLRPHSWMLAASVIFMVIGLSSFYRSLRRSDSSSSAIAQAEAGGLNHEPQTADVSGLPATSISPDSAVISGFAKPATPVGKMRWQSTDGLVESIEVPVYEVSEAVPELLVGDDLQQLVDLNSQLNRRGWAANLDTQIYEGELEDGRRMMVPVNYVRFQSIGY